MRPPIVRWFALTAIALCAASCRRREHNLDAQNAPALATVPTHTESTRDASCAGFDGTYVFRFFLQTPAPELATIPTALRIAEGGPVEVIPPDAVRSDGGVYDWTSLRHPARAIPAGHAVWPRWPIIRMPSERSIATVSAMIQSKRPELVRCHQQHGAQVLAANDAAPPRHRWRIDASLEIEPSGAISNISARPFADAARPLATCVADALRSLTFEPACMTAKVQFSIAGDAPDNANAAQR